MDINYCDTAKMDRHGEEKIGAGLKNIKDECILATKSVSRINRESLTDFKSSQH